MFLNEALIYTPAFYFLIAFTLILTFGYIWGRRLNRRVLMGALDPLLEIFKARDQQFTNIGGQTGFHASIVPGNSRVIRRIDTTVTLLPRQSLLYLPFSFVIRKSDRMQMILFLNKRGKALKEEAHLIDRRFERRPANRIENADSLTREELNWDGRQFALYSSSATSKDWMESLRSRLGTPGSLRHVAILPEQERAYLFLVPKPGTAPPLVTAVRDWLDATVESVRGVQNGAETSG